MRKKTFQFSSASTDYYFAGKFSDLKRLVDIKRSVIITDDNVHRHYHKKFKGWKTITIKAGEEFKVQSTVDSVIQQLISLHAERTWTLVGVGGGVVTDITGYVASIYLRGVKSGFVPTTVLAMVDAAIGGKNGIDIGVYKNMVGTIRQPSFLLYDTAFLKTLPEPEWRSGFAEIIKQAAALDSRMFSELEKHSLSYYRKNGQALSALMQRNALLKTKVVQSDEFELNKRRVLNFGHTLGHALEKTYDYSHGEAVAIGMCFAARLSEEFAGFRQPKRFIELVDRYKLPVAAGYNKKKIFEVLLSDKKRDGNSMNFVLLTRIGKATIKKIVLEDLYKLM
jgi:3-dehydroquinate synthase